MILRYSLEELCLDVIELSILFIPFRHSDEIELVSATTMLLGVPWYAVFCRGSEGANTSGTSAPRAGPQSMMTSVPSCRGKSALSGTWTTYFLGLYSSFDYVLREIKRGLIMVNPCNAHAGTWSPFDLPVSLPDDLLQAHLNEYARLTRSPKVKHGQKPCYVR